MKPRVSAGATVTAAVLALAIVGAAFVIAVPMVLAVVLIVLASVRVTGVYLRSKGTSPST